MKQGRHYKHPVSFLALEIGDLHEDLSIWSWQWYLAERFNSNHDHWCGGGRRHLL